MIKALLIDDEPLARSILRDYLTEHKQIKLLQECNDGFEAIKAINELKPDLIFLDIQMPKITGFELLEVLDDPPAVIFTTAFEEYALKAFEKHAVDYLLKPISKKRFQQAIEKYLFNPQAFKNQTNRLLNHNAIPEKFLERILIKKGSVLKVIPVNTIVFLAADDDYVNIHTLEGDYLINRTLTYYEKNLDPSSFVRVHRSFIVKIDQIQRIEPYEKESYRAILKDDTRINISKTGYPKLMAAFGN